MNNKVRLVLRIVIYVIISLIIGIQIYVINAKLVGGNPYPTPLGLGAGIISSGSMVPTYEINDMIVSNEQDEYHVGDVVVFQEGQAAVVHRIIKIDDKTFQTKGDANNTADSPHPISDIKGKVVFSLSGAGTVLSIIKSPITATVLIVILFIVIWRLGVKEKQEAAESNKDLKEEIEKLKKELGQENNTKKSIQTIQDNEDNMEGQNRMIDREVNKNE